MKTLTLKSGLCLAAAAMFAIGSTAKAGQVDVLLLDINTLDVATSTTPFGLGYTGDVTLSLGSATTLPALSTFNNGIATTHTIAGSLQDVVAKVSFTSGLVTGGALKVIYDNGDATTTTFTADLIPHAASGIGSIASQSSALGTFTFSADINNGQFDNATFGGYDLSPWIANQGAAQGLFGNVITFAINTRSGSADVDIAVLVPMPSSALMGAAALAGLGLVRTIRRRRQVA